MPNKLSKKEIRERLIKLQNLERLYPIARDRIERLEKNNKELKHQLATIVATYDAIIEKMKLRIEELEIMIFGKKKNKKQNKPDNNSSNNQPRKPAERSADSYRRTIPKDDEITDIKDYPIETCPDCGTSLENFKLTVQFKEDIELLQNTLKRIEKQRIQTGFCPHCHKRHTGLPIQPQPVYFGEGIKKFVCYCNVILRLSFAQTRDLLRDLAKIDLSDGEITNILDQQAKKLLPNYNNLIDSIRGQPGAHYDETTYPVRLEEQGKYAWLMTGTENPDTVFKLGQSRGKGNAEKLKGEHNTEQVGITDDYGAYRNLFLHHQLDWAHPIRKLRDLTNSEYLTKENLTEQQHCLEACKSLNTLRKELKEQLNAPFDIEKRQQIKQEMTEQLEKLSIINPNDPEKLKTIKKGLLKNKDKYFTCLLHQDVPTTNNKAERNLRHLVLKRIISRGSKTQKGAWTMSILCSVLLSLWWRKPNDFFGEYSALLNSA